MRLGLIGNGAIAQYAKAELTKRGHVIAACLLRPERVATLPENADYTQVFADCVAGLPPDLDHVIDCAGHAALRQHGADVLRRGFGLTTVSIGALADRDLAAELDQAAQDGKAVLHLATGAIGALDTLRAAAVGTLSQVQYVGRKPPQGWLGSAAERQIDLSDLSKGTQVHFEGNARKAALEYPKNANVAAAVALAGLGFDATEVTLIADPGISDNIHEIHATGDFGSFTFRIIGKTLPGNPRTSALAAMSVVSTITQLDKSTRF